MPTLQGSLPPELANNVVRVSGILFGMIVIPVSSTVVDYLKETKIEC